MNMLLGRTDLIGQTGHNMFKTYVKGALLVANGLLNSYINFHPD